MKKIYLSTPSDKRPYLAPECLCHVMGMSGILNSSDPEDFDDDDLEDYDLEIEDDDWS